MAGRGGKYRGKRRDEPRRYNPREREFTRMLNLHKLTPFRFDIREIMTHYKVDPTIASSVVASVIAKGSRISIKAAKEYVGEHEDAGAVPHDAAEEIYELLDRYSTSR